jgi:MFS family permease
MFQQTFWAALRSLTQIYALSIGGPVGIKSITATQALNVLGSGGGYELASMAYIAELCAPKKRTGMFGVLMGVRMLGAAVGYICKSLLSHLGSTDEGKKANEQSVDWHTTMVECAAFPNRIRLVCIYDNTRILLLALYTSFPFLFELQHDQFYILPTAITNVYTSSKTCRSQWEDEMGCQPLYAGSRRIL